MSDNEFFGGRRRRRAGAAFSPYSLFASGEQGVWYDPSDLTPEKVSWRRNLLTYSQDFENAAWTKSNASILSNLLLYSQDLDNAYWTKESGAITANSSTAPDGTTTADLFVPNTTAIDTHRITRVATTVGPDTFSFYAKASGYSWVKARFSGGWVNFNVSNGTVGFSSGVNSPIITNVGSGWYRCSFVFSTSSTNTFYLSVDTADTNNVNTNNYAGDGTSGILFWGIQQVLGSTAQTYTRSLATAAPIQFADPLGGTLADKLVENTALNIHYQIQSLTALSPASKTYAVSAYLKDADGRFATLGISDVSTGTRFAVANFNLTNGTVAASAAEGTGYAVVSSSIENAGSGWYRCIVVCTAGTTVTSLGAVVGLSNQSAIPTGAGGFVSYTGNGTSGFFIYGAQVEQASTASAYQRITDFNSDFLAAFPTHALYQESTGVTPVTALGQSVGYVVDKRLGGMANQGAQLVANGDFSNGTTSWSTVTASYSVDNGELFVVGTAANGRAEQYGITTTAGRTYRVTFTARSGGGSAPALFVFNFADSATLFSQTFTNASNLTYSGFFTATGSQVFIWARSGTGIAVFDNISVREVPGNHAIQATSAARPTLQARSNLLTQTEDFGASTGWSNVSSGVCTVTLNDAVAPDGSTTADRLTFGGTNSWWGKELLPKPTAGQTFTGSVYIKVADGGADFSLDLVYYPTGGGTNIIQAVTVTSGWQRLSVLASNVTVGTGSSSFVIRSNTTRAVHVWGSQWELNSVPTTYQRVTTATDYADVGLPRNLTFDGIDDSLATAGNVDFATWTVGTRRNLLTVPTMFDDAAWLKVGMLAFGSGSVANATTAPDGTATADLLTPDTNLTAKAVRLVVAGNSGTNTWSFYAKANGYNKVGIWDHATSGAYAAFLLSGAGSVLDSGTGASNATIISVGNGWYRCSFTATVVGSLGFSMQILSPAYTTGGVNSSWTANGTDGAYLWGAQLEVGSTATAFQNVGTDKLTLFSGVFKPSDDATRVIAELSVDKNSNNGVFLLNTEAAPRWYFESKGTLASSTNSGAVTTFAAPVTSVVTGLGDIGGDSSIIRVNGTQLGSNTANQGTGNYGSYVLYIGRRASLSLPFNGRLFQLVIRGAATDSVTVGNAERWVGQLTGVAL